MLNKFELWLYNWQQKHDDQTVTGIMTIIFALFWTILSVVFWKYVLPLF